MNTASCAAIEAGYLPQVLVTVPGEPVGKQRPRASRFGKGGRIHTPSKTRRYEDHVKACAFEAMAGRDPIDGPVRVALLVVAPAPKSWSRKRRDEAFGGAIAPTKKPDIDNVAKSVLDGLNGIVISDDAMVVDLQASKVYGATPRVEAMVIPLGKRKSP